jgi:hypothetical protein
MFLRFPTKVGKKQKHADKQTIKTMLQHIALPKTYVKTK